MTLDEAIAHAKEIGEKMSMQCSTKKCGNDHLQLAAWLEELKAYRENEKKQNKAKLKEDCCINDRYYVSYQAMY